MFKKLTDERLLLHNLVQTKKVVKKPFLLDSSYSFVFFFFLGRYLQMRENKEDGNELS